VRSTTRRGCQQALASYSLFRRRLQESNRKGQPGKLEQVSIHQELRLGNRLAVEVRPVMRTQILNPHPTIADKEATVTARQKLIVKVVIAARPPAENAREAGEDKGATRRFLGISDRDEMKFRHR